MRRDAPHRDPGPALSVPRQAEDIGPATRTLGPHTSRPAAHSSGRRWPDRRLSLVWPLAITALVLGSGVAVAAPLRLLAGWSPGAAALHLPAAYIALAPLCDVLDALSLLSVRQHAALMATVLAAHGAWRWRRRAPPQASVTLAALGELAHWSRLVAVLVGVYAIGALMTRPMAALHLDDPDALVVDFHSHTRASWDGRDGFTVEANRDWHRDAGFDAAYLSDHGTLAGVAEGRRRNPALAGGGTVMLPAIEVRCAGQHVVILGATSRDISDECAPAFLRVARPPQPPERAAEEPVALLTIPGSLTSPSRLPLVRAIEIADGAPRALDQMQHDDARIRGIADRENLALVAGSNNHGWGRTAAAWSVVHVPGWRSLRPEALDSAIRRRLLRDGSHGVSVLERRRVAPGASAFALAATVPAVAWGMLATLSTPERLAWLCWTWAVFGNALLVRRRRRAGRVPWGARGGHRRAGREVQGEHAAAVRRRTGDDPIGALAEDDRLLELHPHPAHGSRHDEREAHRRTTVVDDELTPPE
jgi:predicted metal-dependent phosphoesterase TrpH